MSEAEERGWQGTYFPTEAPEEPHLDANGFIPSSPEQNRNARPRTEDGVPESDAEPDHGDDAQEDNHTEKEDTPTPAAEYIQPSVSAQTIDEDIAEVVFFEYGVVVFFGLEEGQERGILEDISNAEIMRRPMDEDNWEVEECHFEVTFHTHYHTGYPHLTLRSMTLTLPILVSTTTSSVRRSTGLSCARLTRPSALKSSSHLLKLSISHAFAQSTLLARYETTAQRVLSAPETVAIPRQLARSGALQLKRRDALKLTGRLFKLRRDVNLVSNVLDVPELFWSEASLKDLYDAVREYMEIGGRVEALNEKLSVASDLVRKPYHHCSPQNLTSLHGLAGRDPRSSQQLRDGTYYLDHHLVRAFLIVDVRLTLISTSTG